MRPTYLASISGVSRYALMRAARQHGIVTREKGGRHKCGRLCRIVWAALHKRVPVTRVMGHAWRLQGLKFYHPDWPWFDGRKTGRC